MKKSILLVLSSIVFVGCQTTQREPTIELASYAYFIPDSNKQKFSEFVINATKSCQEDCDDAIDKARNVANDLFGEQQYLIRYYTGANITHIYVSPSQMTENQLELFHKKYNF
jgi:hypothetical protein